MTGLVGGLLRATAHRTYAARLFSCSAARERLAPLPRFDCRRPLPPCKLVAACYYVQAVPPSPVA